jgi:hypothetical protein
MPWAWTQPSQNGQLPDDPPMMTRFVLRPILSQQPMSILSGSASRLARLYGEFDIQFRALDQ